MQLISRLSQDGQIPTAVLAEQYKAGELPPVLAKEYGASEEAIWDAIRCELDLQAA